ncbi:MAG: hypothetical protein ABSB18_07835, partial [Candidatus Omnitrophota bacterium]
MLNSFKKTISLNNLDSGCVSGQIATLLIFMMVIVLVMVLVTVNLGEVANFALDLSNGADSAVLAITNNLATYSTLLWEAMGKSYKECTWTLGWLDAIIMIVCIAIGGPFLGGLIGACIVAAVNGIAYGSWDAAVSGFLDGLTFAAACIGGGVAGVGVGNAIGVAGLGQVGMIAGMVSMTTNWVMRDQIKVEGIREAAKQLNGLSQEDMMTQTAVYTAFISTINDPNTIQDYFDSDSNGDNQEKIPYFQFWWDRRTDHLKKKYNTPAITQYIEDFKNNAVIPLITYLDAATSSGGLFARQEIEGSNAAGTDGPLVALLRATQKSSSEQYITFWYRGPNKTNYDCWAKPCATCSTDCGAADPLD